VQPHALWEGVANDSYFYFVHSYYVQTEASLVAAETDYGGVFCCAVAKDNLFATQFHPEKSAAAGLRVYQNFVNWKP